MLFFELYNENILDLLVQSKDMKIRKYLSLMQNDHPTIIKNLIKIPVFALKEAEDIIKFGFADRLTSKTNLNEAPSRAHAVVCIVLITANKFDEEPIIRICDLIDNQPIIISGKQLTETYNINKSIITFKDCIRVLNENQIANYEKIYKKKQKKTQRDVIADEQRSLQGNQQYPPGASLATAHYPSGSNLATAPYPPDFRLATTHYPRNPLVAGAQYPPGFRLTTASYPFNQNLRTAHYPPDRNLATVHYPSGPLLATTPYPPGSNLITASYPSNQSLATVHYPYGPLLATAPYPPGSNLITTSYPSNQSLATVHYPHDPLLATAPYPPGSNLNAASYPSNQSLTTVQYPLDPSSETVQHPSGQHLSPTNHSPDQHLNAQVLLHPAGNVGSSQEIVNMEAWLLEEQ
ncbi:unnamed protein product [Rotaria sordida]|uniref:Kinesin motor domain-containing protein n=1 Tax=Rotaria sordida TaxID=392033 RepID=A0A815A0L4_9BILA|nr:unnamed protein product [Rotaria sordida]CAF1248836.1 unnamed protein product [Rotaria sordida]CAF1530246.1 unnamed protein product [Rotaria sordida]CAF1530304.1 unnamed protein product [Rotaria sordida]